MLLRVRINYLTLTIFNDNLPLSSSDLKVDMDSEFSTLNNDFDVSFSDSFENILTKFLMIILLI